MADISDLQLRRRTSPHCSARGTKFRTPLSNYHLVGPRMRSQRKRMRISYRMTSTAVFAVYVAGIIYSILFPHTSRPTETAATDGTVSFDLCNMWEQMSAMKQLGALLWGTSFMVLL